MQYDVATPQEYLAAIDHDWRFEKLNQLRDIMREVAPEFAEGINYKMLCYQDQRGVVFHLNAQKNYVGFYVGNIDKVDPSGTLLAGMDVGKGCIRLKKTTTIADTGLVDFIKQAIAMWRQGDDIDC